MLSLPYVLFSFSPYVTIKSEQILSRLFIFHKFFKISLLHLLDLSIVRLLTLSITQSKSYNLQIMHILTTRLHITMEATPLYLFSDSPVLRIIYGEFAIATNAFKLKKGNKIYSPCHKNAWLSGTLLNLSLVFSHRDKCRSNSLLYTEW